MVLPSHGASLSFCVLAALLLSCRGAKGQPASEDTIDPALPVPMCAQSARQQAAPAGEVSLRPKVDQFSPRIGHAGDTLTITGRRLTGAVAIFREVTARTLRSTDRELTVRVPASTSGPIVVRSPDGQMPTPDPFVYALKLENPVIFPIPIGGGEWFPTNFFKSFEALTDVDVDESAKFLQRHWIQPLPLQGRPPESWPIVERGLSPQQCRLCHQPQFALWKGSLHAASASKLVRWDARRHGKAFEDTIRHLRTEVQRIELTDDEREATQKKLATVVDAMHQREDSCRRCHDPAAEGGPFTEVELLRAPEDSKQRPVRDGVQCMVCHVRSFRYFGPPALPGAWPEPRSAPGSTITSPRVHNGFTAQQAYEDSRFCAGCHTFTIRVDKGMVGNPFEEWRVSPFAEKGISCQKCHMPDRKHLFRGIHDRDMTLSGLTISLELKEGGGLVTATATIRNTHVGHRFPTYPIPMVHVNLYRSIPEVLKKPAPMGLQLRDEFIIGRQVDLRPNRFVEDWDHRLAPGAALVMTGVFPPQDKEEVLLRIDVVPRNSYEKALRAQITQAERDPSHADLKTLRELLAHEEGLRYRLIDIQLPVPRAGAVVRKTLKEGVWQ